MGKKNEKTKFIKYISNGKYECVCDCGNNFIGRLRSKSCGCHILENHIKDAKKLEGIKFFGIKILSFSHFQQRNNTNLKSAIYNAKCICGISFKICRTNIFKTKTCGCRIINNHARGERQGNNKYKEKDVIAIKELFLTGQYSINDLSSMFNIKNYIIHSFINETSWSHLKIDKKIIEQSPVKDKFSQKRKMVEIGKTYGSWTAIAPATSRNSHAYFLCKCICGNERNVVSSSLLKGKSTKCYDCNSKNFANIHRKCKRSEIECEMSSGNIFADLGIDNPEEELKLAKEKYRTENP